MPKPISEKIPREVVDHLQKCGYRDLVDLSNRSGISRETISSILTGRQHKHKSLSIYLSLAKSLHLTVEELASVLGVS